MEPVVRVITDVNNTNIMNWIELTGRIDLNLKKLKGLMTNMITSMWLLSKILCFFLHFPLFLIWYTTSLENQKTDNNKSLVYPT